jgi:hypothetical protein
MRFRGSAFGVMLTPLAALGVMQAPEDEPGSLPGICNEYLLVRKSAATFTVRSLSTRAGS